MSKVPGSRGYGDILKLRKTIVVKYCSRYYQGTPRWIIRGGVETHVWGYPFIDTFMPIVNLIEDFIREQNFGLSQEPSGYSIRSFFRRKKGC